MTEYQTIIFLDEDGARLSPYAAEAAKYKLKEAGLGRINVFARGAVVLFPEPANPLIVELAAKKGLKLAGYRAKALSEDEFSDETLILSLDNASRQSAYHHFSGAKNIYVLREYVGETGDIKLVWGGTEEDYEATAATMNRVLDDLVKMLLE